MKKVAMLGAGLAVVLSCNSSPDYTGNYSGTVEVTTTTVFVDGDSTVDYSTEQIDAMIYKMRGKLRVECTWAECSCLMCVPPPIEFVGTTANHTCGGGLYAPLTTSVFEVYEGGLNFTIKQKTVSPLQTLTVQYAGTIPKI